MPLFDAIIEGRNPTDSFGLTFKAAKLGIPQGAGSIMDRKAIYPLVGRLVNYGRDFQHEKSSGRQIIVPHLDTCDGLTLIHDWMFGAYLQEPRSVVLVDGRVFSRRGADQFYMQVQLPQALEVTKQLFDDKNLRDIYERRFLEV